MPYLKLKADIFTYDNKTLLPASTEINDSVLKDIISLNKTTNLKSYSLMQHESINKDLMNCISQPPYQWIFSLGEEYRSLLKFMENIYLIQPVLESVEFLKYFDIYTYRHTLTVFTLSTLVATYLIYNYKDHISEIMSSPTHDIGKICIPLDILQKTQPLGRKELDILEQHAIIGYVLLSYYNNDVTNISAIVARDHHEKKNGAGYPYGIYLNNLISEIVVVCDIYDALIPIRPYRPVPYDNRTALEVISEMAFKSEVNIDAVKVLVALNRKDKPDYREIILSKQKRGTPPQINNYRKIVEDETAT
jgi:HD-GYP domain-containing protein (c-di-GMP phosphodiesterase class II)